MSSNFQQIVEIAGGTVNEALGSDRCAFLIFSSLSLVAMRYPCVR